jgi:hypothetical protein
VLIITNFASWIALGSIVAVSTILQIIIFFVIEYMEKRRKLRFVDSGEEKEQMVLSQAQDFINPLTGELATTQV